MAFSVGDHQFEGPYTATSMIQNRPGVYAVICRENDATVLADVGESRDLGRKIKNHARVDCWHRKCPRILQYAVLYTPLLGHPVRREIARWIRQVYDPPCGGR